MGQFTQKELMDDMRGDLGKIAPLQNAPRMDFEAIRGHTPTVVESIWQEYRFVSMFGGRRLRSNPDILQPTLDVLFKGDPNFGEGRMTGTAYSAFGPILAWHSEHWIVHIDLILGLVRSLRLIDPSRKWDADMALVVPFTVVENEEFDEEDEAGSYLFSRARKKLGALDYGECYGFVPALSLGGGKTLDNLRRLPAREHFAILAQAQDFVMRDNLSHPIRDVRSIGAQ